MQKRNVQIGSTYIVKVSGTLAKVRLTRECIYGGWYATNLATGREIRIRTAARLRAEVKPAAEGHIAQVRDLRSQAISSDEARKIVGKIEF